MGQEAEVDGKVQQLPMFELQHGEAHSLVKRALRRLEAKELLSKATTGQPNERSPSLPPAGSSPQPQAHGFQSSASLDSKAAYPTRPPDQARLAPVDSGHPFVAPGISAVGLQGKRDGETAPMTPVPPKSNVAPFGNAAALSTSSALGPELHHVI